MKRFTLTLILSLLVGSLAFAGEVESLRTVSAAQAAELTALRPVNNAQAAELDALRPELVARRAQVDKLVEQLVTLQAQLDGRAVTIVKPGESIQSAVDKGNDVTVMPGVYAQSFKSTKAITISGYGATLDGGEKLTWAVDAGAATVKGFKVTHYASDFESASAAVRVRKDGVIRDLDVDGNVGTGVGIPAGSHNAQVINCRMRGNGYSGLSGTASNGVRIVGGELRDNNAGHVLNLARAAAEPKHFVAVDGKGYVKVGFGFQKFTKSDGLLVDGLVSLDNRGCAFWLDADNHNFTFRNCTFGGSIAFAGTVPTALQIELCHGPGLIENNHFVKTAGPSLAINESSGITGKGNTFDAGCWAEFRALTTDGQAGRNTSTIEGGDQLIRLERNTLTDNTFIAGKNVNAVAKDGSIRPSTNVSAMDLVKAAIVVKGNK